MASRLLGLTGLYPDPQDTTDVMDEGVLESKANVPDPEHGQYGSQALGYSGVIPAESPFSPMSVYDGYDPEYANVYGDRDYLVQGEAHDLTPTTHASPYPRGIIQQSWDRPDVLAVVGEQMSQLHSPDYGGVEMLTRKDPAGHEENTDYTTDNYIAPNENYLAPVAGQLRTQNGRGGGGYNGGNADPTQGYGVLNTLPEFNAGHSIRRVQHDRMPWDFTNTHGEQDVPFYGRHPVGQMPLDGPDSPYFQEGDINGANVVWEGRIGDPSPYQQPPEPAFSVPDNSEPDVFAWG